MPKGGARKGAGRKSRPAPKSKGVWCGQITNEQRDFIMQWLSPDERFSVLMAAANKAWSTWKMSDKHPYNNQVNHYCEKCSAWKIHVRGSKYYTCLTCNKKSPVKIARGLTPRAPDVAKSGEKKVLLVASVLQNRHAGNANR